MATNAQGKPASGDFTGQQKAKLADQHAAELSARAQEMALINAANAEVSSEILDVTKSPDRPVVIDDVTDLTNDNQQERVDVRGTRASATAPTVVDQVSVVDDAEGDGVTVRFNEDLQQVTIGDRVYDFVAGKKYRVPRNVAFHLEEQGKIWH